MKLFFVFILLFMVSSCEYFNVKKTSSEAILNEELQTFNWNDVDVYPTFFDCDSLNTKKDKALCFESVLTNQILNFLKEKSIVVTEDVNDTINLKFKVSETGTTTLDTFYVDSITLQQIPDIKLYIRESLLSLPKIYPAIKRGQQVKTEFALPVIINVE